MTAEPIEPRRDERGFSLIEVLVAITIFAVAILALSSTGLIASHTLRQGRGYMSSAAVARIKLDSLTAVGWAALAGQTGSATVSGYPVSWQVTGANPRSVVVIVGRQVLGNTYADTFATYVREP